MALSDLYYTEEDFVPILNKQIETIIVERVGSNELYLNEKRPFAGITNNVIYGLETIAFKKENPYFDEGIEFKLDTYFDNISVVNEERDMEDIWEENINILKKIVMHEGDENSLQRGKISVKETTNCVYNLFYLRTNNSVADEEINESIDKYSTDSEIRKLLQAAVDSGKELILTQNNKYQIIMDVTVYGNKYAMMNVMANPKQNRISLGTAIIDLENGEKVSTQDVQKWKSNNSVK